MNCLEKMYKEIDEILKREAQEKAQMQTPIKQIKNSFSFEENLQDNSLLNVDYLSNIIIDETYEKKYLSNEKAINFILFIFKKFLCFNEADSKVTEFISQIEARAKNSEDYIELLKTLESEFSLLCFSDNLEEFFTNPYNALFKDENGYYAVIKDGKYSNIRRPFGYNLNQLKKVIKETINLYTQDFIQRFASEKERNAFINSFNANINKDNSSDYQTFQKNAENLLFEFLSKKGVTQTEFEAYLDKKGLRLVKQGGYYFAKKAYEQYAEYKKIEFRY